MKVFRFMSYAEFLKYIKGEKLENKTEHTGNTNSVGFCFMEYEEDYDIEYSYEYLSGIVDEEVICVFEVDKSKLKESWGVYADPYGSFFSTITETEYCTKSYNKNDFKLIKAGFNVNDNFDALNDWSDEDFKWKYPKKEVQYE